MTLVPSPRLKIKTDNRSLEDKLHIRRMVIEEAQIEPLRVLDLYAGEGTIWNSLRHIPRSKDSPRALRVDAYVPVDSAAKQPGQIRFKIAPRLIAALDTDNGLSRFNCIDCDCYGDPWLIWHELLFRIKTRTVVFLTRGRVTYGAGKMPIANCSKVAMGIPVEWNVPGKVELMEYADRCSLLEQCPTAKIVLGYKTELRSVDYYGVLVEPIGG